jgi:hypothetical protein
MRRANLQQLLLMPHLKMLKARGAHRMCGAAASRRPPQCDKKDSPYSMKTASTTRKTSPIIVPTLVAAAVT